MVGQMKIKIISDGTPFGTKITDIETGNTIINCKELVIKINSDNKVGTCDVCNGIGSIDDIECDECKGTGKVRRLFNPEKNRKINKTLL